MKTESMEEYLSRGGKVTKLAYVEPKTQPIPVKPISSSPHVMDLQEGAHYYSEMGDAKPKRKPRKKKLKSDPIKLDKSLLPKGLLESIGEYEE